MPRSNKSVYSWRNNLYVKRSSIVGRKEEQAVLDELYNSDESHLLAVYGRRRVGKTFLIREYFEKELTFYHTALSPKELEDQPDLLYRAQLSEFGKTLGRYGYKSGSIPKDLLGNPMAK